MTITDADRHRLHLALDGVLGEPDAALLMSHLPPSGWSDVIRTQDLARVETRIDDRFARIDDRFVALEARMDGRFVTLETRMDALEARLDDRCTALEARLDDRFGLFEARFERSLAVALKDQTNRTLVALVAIITIVATLLQILSP